MLTSNGPKIDLLNKAANRHLHLHAYLPSGYDDVNETVVSWPVGRDLLFPAVRIATHPALQNSP